MCRRTAAQSNRPHHPDNSLPVTPQAALQLTETSPVGAGVRARRAHCSPGTCHKAERLPEITWHGLGNDSQGARVRTEADGGGRQISGVLLQVHWFIGGCKEDKPNYPHNHLFIYLFIIIIILFCFKRSP